MMSINKISNLRIPYYPSNITLKIIRYKGFAVLHFKPALLVRSRFVKKRQIVNPRHNLLSKIL